MRQSKVCGLWAGWIFTDMSPTELRRTYPIWRGGKNLDDLLVKQCVFMGDEQALPLHVGVIANGHGLVLEHDVFYNVRNAVVFWGAEGRAIRQLATAWSQTQRNASRLVSVRGLPRWNIS